MHPISEGTASSWSAGGSVDFTAPPSSGGVAAGENGNKTKQSWGWKNEKADFFFFWDGNPELLGNCCHWKLGNFPAGIYPSQAF